MPSIRDYRSSLYNLQSRLGDYIPISEGNIGGYVDRQIRKQLLKASGRLTYLPGGGLLVRGITKVLPSLPKTGAIFGMEHNFDEMTAALTAARRRLNSLTQAVISEWMWDVGKRAVSRHMVGGFGVGGIRVNTTLMTVSSLYSARTKGYDPKLFVFGRTRLFPPSHPTKVTIRTGRLAASLVGGAPKHAEAVAGLKGTYDRRYGLSRAAAITYFRRRNVSPSDFGYNIPAIPAGASYRRGALEAVHWVRVSGNGQIRARKASRTPYSGVQEYGGVATDAIGQQRTLPPRPYLQPAMDEMMPELSRRMARIYPDLFGALTAAAYVLGEARMAKASRSNFLSRGLRTVRKLSFRSAVNLGDIQAWATLDVTKILARRVRKYRTRVVQGAVTRVYGP